MVLVSLRISNPLLVKPLNTSGTCLSANVIGISSTSPGGGSAADIARIAYLHNIVRYCIYPESFTPGLYHLGTNPHSTSLSLS